MTDDEPTGEEHPESARESVESLAGTARDGKASYIDRHDAVMKLWRVTLEGDEALHEPAIRALSDVAWDDSHRGLASEAQNRLGLISKEAPEDSAARRLAFQAIRHEL